MKIDAALYNNKIQHRYFIVDTILSRDLASSFFSGSLDRSHLGDHQKIYIFQNFQKLTKLWSVKFESWLGA